MEILKERLLEYKLLTDKLISSINDGREEDFKRLLSEKQLLINCIDELDYDQTEFSEIASEIHLLEQDKKLHKVIEEKKVSIRNEIKNIKKKINATVAYNSAYANFNILNKKI